MPLQADAKVLGYALDGFHDPVFRVGADAQARSGSGDGLVVEAVYVAGARTQDVGEPGAGFHAQLVTAVVVGSRIREIEREVVVEGAASPEGEELHPVADPEDGELALQCEVEHACVELDLGLGREVECDVGRVGSWRAQVVATREQEAVDSSDEVAQVAWIGLDRQV
jgi:hypothetical protein